MNSSDIRINSEELDRAQGLSGVTAKMGTLEGSSLNKKNRVAAHSHVKGLGLNHETGEALPQASGFIGQCQAREACGIIVDLVKQKKMSGRAVLLAGASGTGKTAIALAVSQELGDKVPGLDGEYSQIYRSTHKRKKRSYGKTISHVLLSLKTTKGSKQLKLDPSIYDSLMKQKVNVGDVIYIEAGTGAVKRMGRSDLYANEFDLDADEFVPMPKGDVHKSKDTVQYVTLYDFDLANSMPQGRGSDMLSFMNQVMKHKKTEITERLRTEVNKVVNSFIEAGQAELLPGVLFIDEVHMLDLECFTFLHRALESAVSPIVIFATNRGLVKTSDFDGPLLHGIPNDLLDRLLIVNTKPYSLEEVTQILKVRSEAEDVKLSEQATAELCKTGHDSSLRYAIQLLTPAKLLAQIAGREIVEKSEIDQCKMLFSDRKTSAQQCETLVNNGP
uniref:RuvB-like helicase n=1 Tax=Ditylenchus dipsaci TaxID=166011 RepID=A0A915E3K5_9BILA